MRVSHLFFFPLLFIFLAGCGTAASVASQAATPAPTAVKNALSTVDWNNFTYTVPCFGGTRIFHAKAGQASNQGIHFAVYANKSVYGNLTGGEQVAVISYSCTGADFGGVRILVFGGSATHPVLIGSLPLASQTGSDIRDADSVVIQNGEITLSGRGFSANAPHCCPDQQMRLVYRWDSKQFTLVQAETMPLK